MKAKGEKGEKGEKSAPVKAAKPKKAFGVQNFQSAVLLGTFAALIGAAAGLVTSGGSFFTLNLGTVATGRRHQHRHVRPRCSFVSPSTPPLGSPSRSRPVVAYSVFLIDGSPAQLFSLVALLSRFTLDITLKIALEVAHRQFAFQSKQY